MIGSLWFSKIHWSIETQLPINRIISHHQHLGDMLKLRNNLDDDLPLLGKWDVRLEPVEAEHLNVQVALQETQRLSVQPTLDLLPNAFNFLCMHDDQAIRESLLRVERVVVVCFETPHRVLHHPLFFLWRHHLNLDIHKALLVIHLVVLVPVDLVQAIVRRPTICEDGCVFPDVLLDEPLQRLAVLVLDHPEEQESVRFVLHDSKDPAVLGRSHLSPKLYLREKTHDSST